MHILPLPPVTLATEAHTIARAMVLDLPASPERETLLSVLARQGEALKVIRHAHGRDLGAYVAQVLGEAGGSPLAAVGVTETRARYRRRVRWAGIERVEGGPFWLAALAVHRVATCPRAVARLAALDAMPPVAMRRAA